MKKVLFLLLLISFCLSTSAELTFTEEIDISSLSSPLTISVPGLYHIFMSEKPKYQIEITVQTKEATLVLDNIYILNTEAGKIPLNIKSGDVTIVMEGSSFIGLREPIMGSQCCPAIRVAGDATLTFDNLYEKEDVIIASESLEVIRAIQEEDVGDQNGVAIGGAFGDEITGSITFNAGTVIARGERGCGAIGTCNPAGSVSPITINGKETVVKAYSGLNWPGATIGPAKGGIFDSITINDGRVEAYGEDVGAAIGYGRDSSDKENEGKITINGGTVIASNNKGPAIGFGTVTDYGDGIPMIEINGGNVTAFSKEYSAIFAYKKGKVRINGGTITADNKNSDFDAIGSYKHSVANPVIISGGSIKVGKADIREPFYERGDLYVPSLISKIPDAMAPVTSIFAAGDGEVTFTANTRDIEHFSYSYTGEGHEGDDSLYFYLPGGNYTVTGTNGKTYAGEAGGTFTLVPEPAMFGLLAIVALERGPKEHAFGFFLFW